MKLVRKLRLFCPLERKCAIRTSIILNSEVSATERIDFNASVDWCIGFCPLCGGVRYRESLLDGGSTVEEMLAQGIIEPSTSE